MVEFIESNGNIFCIARDLSTAFFMWKRAQELNQSVVINGINYGNDWQAWYEIEKLFGVSFIESNGNVFCIARDPESAFYMWKKAKELDQTVVINGINYGNDWEARYEIEKLFGVSYSLNVCIHDSIFPY